MWLLRMPAASAVGIIALISVLPGRLLGAPPGGWVAVAALAAVSFGYLLVEVRNHGVARGTALWRALLVALGGAAHALMVSLIGLVAVAPAFVNDGTALSALWRRPSIRARRDGAGARRRVVPGGRRVLADPVGRPADHRAAGAPELAESMMEDT